MATGDISTVTVLATGWQVTCQIAGLSTGGTYAFGLGANNDPATGTPKITFNVTSLGFDDTGTATTVSRKVYGTIQERKVFPNVQTANESGSSPVTVAFELDDYIYQSDTIVNAIFFGGFYTQAATPSNAYAGAATNNSTLAYPRVVGNWSWPGYDKLGSTVDAPRMTCFHKFARNGRQVACVKFTVTDSHAHTVSQVVTQPRVDRAMGDPVPVIEYIGNLNLSGASFTQGDVCARNFKAYPWIGDAAAVLDTTDGGATAAPTPLYGPQPFVYDAAGTYCPVVAVVNSTTGVDTSNTITGADTSAAAAATHPFLTIAGAYNALRTYNNSTFSRNNCGGATIYLQDNAGGVNNYAWAGGSVTVGTTPDCNLTITIYPGNSRSNVVIATSSGGKSLGLGVKISGVLITAQSASGVVDTASALARLWVDNCELNLPTANQPFFYRNGVNYTTRCTLTEWAQCYNAAGVVNAAWALVRGNRLNFTNANTQGGRPYTFIGNYMQSSATTFFVSAYTAGQTTPNSDNLVWCFNYISAALSSNTFFLAGSVNPLNHGLAFVQNLVENVGTAIAAATQFAADGSSGFGPINNIIMHNTVIVGQRYNMAYNENGASLGAALRTGWSHKNNIWDNENIKTDSFPGNSASATRSFAAGTVTVTVTQNNHNYVNGDSLYLENVTPSAYNISAGTVINATTNTFQYAFISVSDPGAITAIAVAPNPLRINNWSENYSVGMSGNVRAQTANIGAPGAFLPNFSGLKTLCNTITQPLSSSANCATNTLGYIKFVNRTSYTGLAPGTGGGNYALQPTSPAVNIQRSFCVPFDMNGNPRLAADAAGLYGMQMQRGLLMAG